MIAKAKTIDEKTDYIHALLPDYQPSRKFDFVHSMEFLYYLNDPENMLKLFHDHWLEDGGWAVIGIDHYTENEDSLSWRICRCSWQQGLLKNGKTWQDAGFVNINHGVAGGMA